MRRPIAVRLEARGPARVDPRCWRVLARNDHRVGGVQDQPGARSQSVGLGLRSAAHDDRDREAASSQGDRAHQRRVGVRSAFEAESVRFDDTVGGGAQRLVPAEVGDPQQPERYP